MRIEAKRTFLHGRDRYEKGDLRTVDDSLGAYFVKQGWAAEVGKPAPEVQSGEVSLDIHNARMGVKERKNG